MPGISLIVPLFNTAARVEELVKTVDEIFASRSISYEILFIGAIDEDLVETIKAIQECYQVRIFRYDKRTSKAKILTAGIKAARHDVIGTIDAGLTYPADALWPMYKRIRNNSADVVIGRRMYRQSSWIRRIVRSSFRYFMVELLHNLEVDAQSGIKVFLKEVYDISRPITSTWIFDLQFILQVRKKGYLIRELPVEMNSTSNDDDRINLWLSTWHVGILALNLKLFYLFNYLKSLSIYQRFTSLS